MKLIEKIRSSNDTNKGVEKSIVQTLLFVANTWVTLLAPLVIGVFVNRLFSEKDFSQVEYVSAWVFGFFHFIFVLVIYMAATKNSISLEVDKVLKKNKFYEKKALPKAERLYENLKRQQMVSYLMTLELENAIDKFNSWSAKTSEADMFKEWEFSLDRMLLNLAVHRTELFEYNKNALYNICLYLYDDEEDSLLIKWRRHDDRLNVSNRSWKPGAGHVGLTYMLNEIKICKDIVQSTELSTLSLEKDDFKKYRSFLSVPIKDSSQLFAGGKPLGVLVFTSSAVDQFSLERDKIFALTVAKILAIYIDEYVKSHRSVKNEEER